MSSVDYTDNGEQILRELEEALQKAARMIGGSIEGHAKEACPVDTGLLRNSITYAIGGEAPAEQMYTSNDGGAVGQYTGQAPNDKKGEVTVYVGTNVQYAPYQELGAPNRGIEARPFIRPAFEDNTQEFEQIFKKCLGK